MIEITRFIKKTKKSAFEDFENHIFLEKIKFKEFLKFFPLKKTSHNSAIIIETAK